MTVKDYFDSLDYAPAPESRKEVDAWLDAHGHSFGHFIGGTFSHGGEIFPTKNPATGEGLAELRKAGTAEIDAAVAAARRAQKPWAKMGGHGRARVLYALARQVQKHSRALAVLETLDNGKPIRESRDIDVPLVARHFYYHAGLAQLIDTEMPDAQPMGVCAQVIPWNFPLLMLAWKIAPALAAGNTVVLKPAEYTSLSAMMFAELAIAAGVPKGVINIITGDGETGAGLVAHEGVDKVAFTGSTDVGRAIRRATAGHGKGLTLELGGKSPYIVFDDADIDSAVEGLVDAIWFNQGQVCCAGARLLVHEAVADDVHARLKTRMEGLRIGNPLDKCIDMGAIVDPVQLDRIKAMVGATTGAVHHAPCDLPDAGCFYPPTLITGLGTADELMQEEIFGPVLVSCTFRTPDEAVALANNTRFGLAASVWSENVNLALDIAPKLDAGVIWVNGTNMFDAAAPFGGMKESGFGREGGPEGLRAYLRGAPDKPLKPLKTYEGLATPNHLDRTQKLYIGGKQTRPDGGYTKQVFGPKGYVGDVAEANRKDIRNAVEAANKAAGWGKTPGHLRAQILYYMAENMEARSDALSASIKAQTGADAQVDQAIQALFTWAAWADKHDGRAAGVPLRGVALAMPGPVGTIGAFCAEDRPLVALCQVIGAAMAMGNRLIAVAPESAPLIAGDIYQILETSDVPGGVVNLLTGDHGDLAAHLAGHMDVDAVWSFSHADISAVIEAEAAHNLKRTWVNNGRATNWTDTATLRAEATQTRTIWIPYGE